MAPSAKYNPLLSWWLLFTIISLGAFAMAVSGIFQKINDADFTKISFLIFAIFLAFTVRTGRKTYRLYKAEIAGTASEDFDQEDELGWFVSDMLLTLGMIGTVLGFIYMLGTSFQNFNPGNVSSLQDVLSTMGVGMSTALYTTAAGLVCSLLLKLQLFNFSQRLDRLAQQAQSGKISAAAAGESPAGAGAQDSSGVEKA